MREVGQVLGDGDGWVGQHWGRFGAAGLLLIDVATMSVLLQHRASWVVQGDTWALPGGARDSHETCTQAALREAQEECGIDVAKVRAHKEVTTFRAPGWSYTTVVATCVDRLDVVPNGESHELRWVPVDLVPEYDLLPAFRASWAALKVHVAELTA
ncbi:NUDIX hydrolase [Corynebacterium felinum]|uniref:8-oxo-dGTP diphosphatase n=1 Tax=Corynebacterium felinum TaxID=131318 RepID=A0ABU2B5K2_9CORY|nr:NUDIX hydrolase [Corynebacterium felinum]MDF5820145.1 NUDIX hydrolase [Corynebacterium felinum]MDR7353897.1 8-oxo-dGTP diphosphatase [Corynebacterium felinum]